MKPKIDFDKLSVDGHNESNFDILLNSDDYILLSFRISDIMPDFYMVRLGDYRESLLELMIGLSDKTLSGLTLVCYEKLSKPPEVKIKRFLHGLPVMTGLGDLTVMTSYSYKQVIIDLMLNFEVCHGDDVVTIWWSGLIGCEAYVYDKSTFLVKDGKLVGARFDLRSYS